MQIVSIDNLHKMSNPVSRDNLEKKNISKAPLLKILTRVLTVFDIAHVTKRKWPRKGKHSEQTNKNILLLQAMGRELLILLSDCKGASGYQSGLPSAYLIFTCKCMCVHIFSISLYTT